MFIKKILAPVDGSPKSLRSLKFAVDLGDQLGAEVVAVNVQRESDVTIVEPISWEAPVLRERAERVFNLAREALDEKAGKVTYKMLQGDPVNQILKYADQEKFSLVVIGDYGLSGIQRTLLGSVTSKVTNLSIVPVLVVK